MTDDDRISAWLDGELDSDEAARFESELAADEALRAELDSVAGVRALLRAAGRVSLEEGALERIVRAVAAEPEPEAGPGGGAVVALESRRRVPTLAAVAASFIIVLSVVGGVGGDTTLPAVGDLVARHAAAAAADDMPPSDEEAMADAKSDGPAMPSGYVIAHAWRSDDITHMMYAGPDGSMLSVFQQVGETDVAMVGDEMGGKGDVSDMGGTPMWSGSVADTHVAVLDGDGYLWTFVGDADHDTMEIMMAELPGREPGLIERMRDAADAIVEPFRLGWR